MSIRRVHSEATVSLARGKLSFFQKRLNVDEELSHRGNDSEFVGFTAITEPFDVRGH